MLNATVKSNTYSNGNGPNLGNCGSNPLVSHVDINMLIIIRLLAVVVGSLDQIAPRFTRLMILRFSTPDQTFLGYL